MVYPAQKGTPRNHPCMHEWISAFCHFLSPLSCVYVFGVQTRLCGLSIKLKNFYRNQTWLTLILQVLSEGQMDPDIVKECTPKPPHYFYNVGRNSNSQAAVQTWKYTSSPQHCFYDLFANPRLRGAKSKESGREGT